MHASRVTQSCLTLCDPMDWSPPGSSVHGIPQARVPRGLPFLSPEDLPDPGIKPRSPALTGRFFATEPPGKPWMVPVNRDSPTTFVTGLFLLFLEGQPQNMLCFI